jgi:hypothetical protein
VGNVPEGKAFVKKKTLLEVVKYYWATICCAGRWSGFSMCPWREEGWRDGKDPWRKPMENRGKFTQ